MRRATLMPATATSRSRAIVQVVREDPRIAERVRRLDLDAAAALRPQLADRRRERRERMRALARLVGRQRLHVELDVGTVDRRIGARERDDLAGGERQRAGAEQAVLHADAQPAEPRVDLVVQRALARLVDEAHLQVVLQVLADAGQRRGRAARRRARAARAGRRRTTAGSAASRSRRPRARPRRAASRPTHPAVLAVLDAARAIAVERDARDLRRRLDRQVRPLQRRASGSPSPCSSAALCTSSAGSSRRLPAPRRCSRRCAGCRPRRPRR